MNSGGEPERDDTGLPPVDIEIPDDARELDRDVQAYYREQRAERRRLRHRRLRRKIARDGFLLPLLACCLILALITGTLLTVFTATSDQNPTRLPINPATRLSPAGSSATSGAATTRRAAHGPSSKAAPSGAASGSPSTTPASSPGSRAVNAGNTASASARNPVVVQTGAPLPAGTLRLVGSGTHVALGSLGKTMLVLVPPACRCNATVSWLAGIGASHSVLTYLVGTRQTIGEARKLHSRLPGSLQTKVQVALDTPGLLAQRYPVKGLTAVVVAGHSRASQSAAYAQNLSVTDHSAPLVRALTG